VRAYTQWEDFTTGEQNAFKDLPERRWVDGEQWHILSFLAVIFHNEIKQRSGECVQRLDSIEPNETAPHRFFYDRL